MVCAFGRRLGLAVVAAGLLTSVQHAARGQNASNRSPVQPYTAKFTYTTVQTLADGTTISRKYTMIMARDSRGRTLRESYETTDSDPRRNLWASVIDPTDNSTLSWLARNHEASRLVGPPPSEHHGCWETDSGSGVASYDHAANANQTQDQGGDVQREDLGTKTIDGILVIGRRITRTLATGAIGNNEPLVTVTELWQAPSLGGLTLQTVTNDPRTGETKSDLVSLDLHEPDPTLFLPPANYRTITEQMHQVDCSQLKH